MESPLGTSGRAAPATSHGLAIDSRGIGNADDREGSWRDHEGRGVSGAAPGAFAAPDVTAVETGAANASAAGFRLPDCYFRYLGLPSSSDGGLQPAEVLELLLHFGGSTRQAGSLATQLLNRFGSLSAVVTAEPSRLSEVLRGDDVSIMLLAVVRSAVQAIVREPLEDRPVIGSASALMDYLSVTMRHEPTEVTRVLFLDRKNALIKDEIQHRGTVDHAALYPREVIKRVLELGASAVILVHNHPSGDPTPSPIDIEMTRQLAAALTTINVLLHDHVIVGRNKETSLRKAALI
jgi:DNA repair protein RadC